MPKICVCAAPDTPTAQRSLFMELILGAIALGGGEFTVVSVVDLVVEFEVDSVTMAWAIAADIPIIKAQLIIILVIHVKLLG